MPHDSRASSCPNDTGPDDSGHNHNSCVSTRFDHSLAFYDPSPGHDKPNDTGPSHYSRDNAHSPDSWPNSVHNDCAGHHGASSGAHHVLTVRLRR